MFNEAIIYFIQFSIVLLFDLCEFFNLLFDILFHLLRYLSRLFCATFRDLMVQHYSPSHFALFATRQLF